jgi:Immunity protein 27
MKVLQSHETELVGAWIIEENQVHGDETCERINWLVENVLQKIGYNKEYGARETLYREPSDGRFGLRPTHRAKCMEVVLRH